MFKEPTVIIVGAGASVEFGLPSGAEVFQDFTRFCRLYVEKLKTNRGQSLTVKDNSFLKICDLTSNGAELKPLLKKAAETVDFQFNASIDEYLYDNPSFYEFGKIYSANHIIHGCFEVDRLSKAKQKNNHLKNYIILNKVAQKSWISSLVKLLTEGAESVEDLAKNKLTIVTFNYDRIVEDTVLTMLQNTEKFQDIQNIDFLPVLHVNGDFQFNRTYLANQGRQSWQSNTIKYSNPEWEDMIFNNSKRIFMINEPVSVDVKKWRKQARQAVSEANKIYSIGFACAKENIKLIGLADAVEARFLEEVEFFALNFDGNVNLQRRLSELLVVHSQINGTADKPMGCSRAAELGFFSQ